MPCRSGCCSPPAAPPPPPAAVAPAAAPPIQNDAESCCGDAGPSVDDHTRILGPGNNEGSCSGSGNVRASTSTSCRSACCGGLSKETAKEEVDDCCKPTLGGVDPGENTRCHGSADELQSSKPFVNPDDGCCSAPGPASKPSCCKAACTAPKQPAVDDTPAPTCCEGKANPCCDESCLERLAVRECESSDLGGFEASSSRSARKSGKPCTEHRRKIRRTYGERLKALGCICRALLALGQESCCKPQRRATDLPSRTSVDACCAPNGTEAASCSAGNQQSSKDKPSCSDAASTGSRHGKTGPTSTVQKLAGNFAHATHAADLEKGPASNEKEHVVLSISGMTCTGCETKLSRVLGTYPAVMNLKTSLVLSRAEFDLTGATPAIEVMKHLERTTEFKCERVANQGSSIDIIVPGDATTFVDQPWPEGVIEVRPVDKKTVNVSFDAKIIGVRDLIERGWGDGPVRLAPPRRDQTLEAGNRHVRHVGYMTLVSACLTVPVLVMAWAPLPENHIAYASASLALATAVQFGVAGPFYPQALKALLFSKVIEMDLLVVLSTSTAYVFSVVSFAFLVAGQPLSTGGYFETSTLLVTLIMIGRWVAALARQKAVESISIRSLQTPTALIVTGHDETEIDVRLLQYGDIFKIVPDSKVPTDGTVISGSSEVDESMITGESQPVEKHYKSSIVAGSINCSGTLQARVTRLPGENTISAIAKMVDEAKLSKPKIQAIADRFAGYFVPVILGLSIATFCIWIAIGIRVRSQTGREAAIQAITYAIAVLIVSCPCAIGLAVPMVIVIASGVAAERGIIFRSAEAIEVMHKTSHVIFDKTGTITEGNLSVTQEWYAVGDEDLMKSLLLGLVQGIKHPVSAAVAKHLKSQGVSASSVSALRVLTGKGVEGIEKGSGLTLKAGNSRWLNLTENAVVQGVLSRGCTAFCFTTNASVVAILGLQDSIRSDAASTIASLLGRGISVHMISGDDDGAVRAVAAQLNIPEANVRSRCTPADKQAYTQGLLGCQAPPNHNAKAKGPKQPVVVFCGDGTNDAAALAQATIGVHVNEGGTDVAKSAADVVLMRPGLGGVLIGIDLSKKSINRVFFNFGWSFIYNLFAILLAAGAFVKARIPPEFAGLGELVSVLPVVAAATLLRWVKI